MTFQDLMEQLQSLDFPEDAEVMVVLPDDDNVPVKDIAWATNDGRKSPEYARLVLLELDYEA